MQQVIDDLNKRKLKLEMVICSRDDGKLQLLSYDKKGLVSFLSSPVDKMNISEQMNGNMVRQMVTLAKTES